MSSSDAATAEEAVRQGSSSFLEMDVKEHVTLLPSYLGKVGRGVTEVLAGRILHYHSIYGGVLMAFGRVRVLHRAGQIFDELPHIHIDIQYSATIFRPQVGDVMCGVVNKVGVDHIGCLLFRCFNTAVSCSPLTHLSPKQQQRRLKSWCSREFSAGERVWFSVSCVEVTGRLLSLRGEYVMEGEEPGVVKDGDKLERRKEKKKKKKKERQEENKKRKRKRPEAEGEGEGDCGEVEKEKRPEKKTGKKKRKVASDSA